MVNNIENRVTKLEDRIGIGQKAETVDEMWEKFKRGEYGQSTVMSIVASYMSTTDKEQFFESLRRQLPGPLVDAFAHHMTEHDRA